ncbi:efflux RND transporter periplasmic adaptor subunit [Agrobacterium sp. B1(2019)]|uniref:efflux RND transporter periplasmic adaptor subunit n=1 Tax=Agrobacterium sp. B1(2019) TaxID=2607032 RepID=UPI0011EBC172|nr:efflux RND transporter periplasmic adaptor subunit [Agrobacterium sp. B1(2019)]TZG33481.1 efflux RND transporter periplasmic adaptor subunit [Agrobacterium sp. B1(2019)]
MQGYRHYRVTRSRLAIMLGLALMAASLAACDDHGSGSGQSEPPQTAVVARPKTATVTRYLYATGTTKALNSVDLVARVSGTLTSIDYKDGTEVKAGQRLFLIEPDQYHAQFQQAEASVEQAQATLDNAQRQLDRQDQLARTSVTTEANVDNARASRDTAKAQLDAAKASLVQARLNLGYTTVSAPFDGFVTEHQADVGALVGSGSATTLATIVQLDPIHVSFSISDTEMLEIREQVRKRGLTLKDVGNVDVEAGTQIDNDFPYKGKLDYVAPQTAADTGTLSVRAVFDNKDLAFLPGLFVRIRIPVETIKDALLVPPSSIGTDQEGRFVLIVNNSGVVERKSVTLLERNGDLQQIAGSLSSGDLIVTNALAGVRAGEVVRKRQTSLQSSQDEIQQVQGTSAPATD